MRAARLLGHSSGAVIGGVVWLAATSTVLADGPTPTEPPSPAAIFLGWTFEPLPTLAIALATGWWLWAVHRVDAAHP